MDERGWRNGGSGVGRMGLGLRKRYFRCAEYFPAILLLLTSGISGFALFFSIFDLTRRVASQAKNLTEEHLSSESRPGKDSVVRNHPARIVHAMTLVAGGAGAGLVYELASRPWDAARKAVHIDRITSMAEKHSNPKIVIRKLQEEGLQSFFENPIHTPPDPNTTAIRRRINSTLRTLARVGPWGMGFLMWEVFGPGVS